MVRFPLGARKVFWRKDLDIYLFIYFIYLFIYLFICIPVSHNYFYSLYLVNRDHHQKGELIKLDRRLKTSLSFSSIHQKKAEEKIRIRIRNRNKD